MTTSSQHHGAGRLRAGRAGHPRIWDGTPGTGNTFHDNILYNNPGGLGRLTAVQAYNNITTNPQYANPTTHNYQTPPTSPTAPLNLWNGRFPDGGEP